MFHIRIRLSMTFTREKEKHYGVEFELLHTETNLKGFIEDCRPKPCHAFAPVYDNEDDDDDNFQKGLVLSTKEYWLVEVLPYGGVELRS